jgi:nucleotide-binding universal stress UspA family protein
MLFSRILVGVDGSAAAEEAVVFGARLAREHNGQLILAHSVNWLPVVSQLSGSGAIVDTNQIVINLKILGEALLDRAAEAARAAGVGAQRQSLEGEPALRLLELAAQLQCTAIVLGTHNRGPLEQLFVGSTTVALLRAGTIPVLTVRSGATHLDADRRCFERIVVGIDDSEPSDAAVATVLGLPAEDREQLFVYSVAATIHDRKQAERIVANAVTAADACGACAKGCVIGGNPAVALLGAAQERGADLIVLGSHGRQGLHRLFLGSVAEHVVRSARLPVLVVRTQDAADVSHHSARREPSGERSATTYCASL